MLNRNSPDTKKVYLPDETTPPDSLIQPTHLIMELSAYLLPLIILIVFLSVVTVQQGTVAVTTIFGKYNRTLYPGLNFKIPLIETVFKRISIQSRFP